MSDWKVTGRTATRQVTEWTLIIGDDIYTVERVKVIGHDGPAWKAYIDDEPIGDCAYDDPDEAMGAAEALMAERFYLK